MDISSQEAKRRLIRDYNKVYTEELKKILIKRSSGTLSYYAMRKMDYPYATKHETPLKIRSIINSHRGTVKRGWRIQATEDKINIRNTSRIYNKYLKYGTSKMVSRGNIEQVSVSILTRKAKKLLEDVLNGER